VSFSAGSKQKTAELILRFSGGIFGLFDLFHEIADLLVLGLELAQQFFQGGIGLFNPDLGPVLKDGIFDDIPKIGGQDKEDQGEKESRPMKIVKNHHARNFSILFTALQPLPLPSI
jgi:hypothetical protein